MVVAVAHFANPGHDLHDPHIDDVLAGRRQAEIQEAVDALSRFNPTRVVVEWPSSTAATRYAAYRSGTLPPSRSEVVQLAFRLARKANLAEVEGVDVSGDFPYEALEQFAKANGETATLASINALWAKQTQDVNEQLKTGSIRDLLRFLNAPDWIAKSQNPYRLLLTLGRGSIQPGADILAAWYRRNFLISANIVQAVRPGDRVVIFYGAGHAFLLRQLISEMPEWVLVEPDRYL